MPTYRLNSEMVPECHPPLDAGRLTEATPWKVPVKVLQETTSSNDELLRIGEGGAPTGSILFAEYQSAGRGQFRRAWSSAPGLGLWFSLLLRLPVNDATIPSLSAFAAVALVREIEGLGIVGCRIKSPNDVLILGRKVAGILVETRSGRDSFAVVGIGLNVLHSDEDFPGELRSRACSLSMMSARPFDRMKVAISLLGRLYEHACMMETDPGLLLSFWNEMLATDSVP
jgi:BirA family transcriptional regulator, biotin operon repressor / biotin---[acetyl-CoA-carboxylase] ligase